MLGQSPRFYAFGPYRLDPDEKVLFHEGQPVPLTPKAVDTLLVLVSRHGHVVGKDELMRAVWPNTFVEENNLTQNISALRRVLGDGIEGRHFIETVPRRGYRFVGEVTEPANQLADASPKLAQATPALPAAAFRSWLRGPRPGMLAAALVLTAVAVLVVVRTQRDPPRSEPFARMRIARLTDSGNVTAVALSPDGSSMALATDEDGRQALWIRQLAAATGARILPAAEAEYWGLTFSPDGQFLYCLRWEPNRADPVLSRVSVFGGAAQRLNLVGTLAPDGPVTFAPDGRRLAYLATAGGESRLMVANADGTDLRTLAARRDPDLFATLFSAPAWSPDGSSIVVGAGVPGTTNGRQGLVTVSVSDGAQRSIGSTSWASVGRTAWTADGKGLVVTANDERWAPRQIWYVSIPDGAVRRVTNDVDEYRDVSISDTGVLVALQASCVSKLWIAPGGRQAAAKHMVTEAGKFDGIEGMSWTPDGRLVYRSRSGGSWDLWMLKPGQQEPHQLTFDPNTELHPSVSPDGASVVFASDRSGRYALFQMPLEGGAVVRLTADGEEAVYPSWAGDGWVVFQTGFMWFKPLSIWKVSPSGGVATRLALPTSLRPAASPDGRRVAYYSLNRGRWVIRVISIDGGSEIGTFPLPANSSSRALRWMPDGRAFAYIVTVDGVSNVWKQALEGGSPEPVTDFSSDRMVDFAWSRDGRLLAVMQAVETSDAVRITDFR